ncbi:MAG: hypothetical protein FD180_4478 [Planctomycetota bacterium]|nr:MAG: hypothetical protein FD180_4478 [Planctomycetota bacterium]
MFRSSLLLLAALASSLPAFADDTDLKGRLEREYVDLGAEDPEVREIATEQMLNEGVSAGSFVRNKLAAEKDPEVNGRLLVVLRAIEHEEVTSLERTAETELREISRLDARIAGLEAAATEESFRVVTLARDLAVARRRLEQTLEEIGKRLDCQVAATPTIEQPAEPEKTEYLRGGGGNIGDFAVDPRIDCQILYVDKDSPVIVISAGSNLKVETGMKFTVYRGSQYVSKIVVTAAGAGFASCRELLDFRKEPLRQGDPVSTRVFD